MGASSPTDADLEARIRRQEVVSDLSQQALETDDFDRLLRDAVTAVSETANAERCHVLELLSEANAGILRRGVGSEAGAVETVPIPRDSPAGTALRTGEPVAVDDLRTDDRFAVPESLAPHGVRSGISVCIGSTDDPWGVLELYASEQRGFTESDAAFARRVASVLESAIDDRRAATELEEVYGRISDAFFALDEEWRFTYLNERAHELINPDGRTLIGTNVWEEFPDAAGREFKPKYERAMNEQESVSFEEYYPDPIDAWFEVRAYPSPTGLSVYFRDVTERRERERELRQYEAIVEAVDDGVYVVDDGRFTMVNDAYAAMVGYDREELLGEHVSLVVDEDVRERARRAADAMRDGVSDVPSVEAELKTAGGDRVPAEATFALLSNADGSTRRVGVVRDISDRRERERRLEESERRYRTLVEQFPNGVVALVDEDLRYRTVGGNPVDVADVTADEIEGVPVEEAVPPALADELVPRYEAAMDGKSSAFEATSNGRVYDFRVVPVRDDDGEVFAALGMSQDITERREYERRLEESEQRYRTLAEYFPNGIVTLFDPDFEYTLAAGRGFDQIPVEPGDLEGRRLREVWPDETVSELEPAFRAALSGEEASVELEYADREWVLHAVPITDERGDVFAGMTMAQDITEQKERERYLADAKSQLEAATEAGAVGAWEWDVQADEMVVDPSFAETFGIDPDAARNGVSLDRFTAAIHEDDRDRVEAEIEAAVESGGEYESEYRVRNVDDEVRWVVARGRVECDDDGAPVGFPGALTDITERKRAQLELERNKDQLESLFEILPVGVIVADGDGRMIQANDTAREIWGGDVFDADSVAEYEKYPIRWADSGEPVEPDEMTLARVLDGEEVREPNIFEIDAADGERRIVRAEGVPIRDERGEVTRSVVTITDITERRTYQRRLAESERRYRTLIDHFPNGAVGLFDENLRYQIAGGGAFDEIGADAETIVGKTLWERYPEELAARLEPEYRAALEGETNAFEIEFHGRDWMAYTVPVTDDEGEIFGGMVMVQDITAQKDRERKLRERKKHLERYETIVEAVDDGVYVVDADGRFTMVNETYADMLDHSRDELVGTDAARIVEDDIAEQVAELEAAAAEGGVDWPTIEAELRTAGGDTLPVEATFATLPEDDSAWHRVGIVRDISERKARERRLEESERRYRTLVENFPEGAVGLFDENLEYTAVGGQLHDEVGIATADRVGNSVSDIYPDRVVEEVEPYFRAALEGETNAFEIEFYGRHLYAHTLPVRNAADEIFAGMVVVQDVTERREYRRRLEESNERLEQFAYAASHDLQEPLRMVTSYLQLIEKRYGDAFDEDGEEFLAYAVDGAERMRAMIDALLEYSRVETRGNPFEPTDLNAVLAEVLEDLQLRIEESDAEITTAELPRVEGDASQLRQVFQNLLSNAITYSGDEPPRVHVGAERRDGEWVISVRDEGIGIDPADQERVFSIFDRLHGREEYDGTGIGLALCERIVERHGGDIWVDSEPGEGATFSFTLPA